MCLQVGGDAPGCFRNMHAEGWGLPGEEGPMEPVASREELGAPGLASFLLGSISLFPRPCPQLGESRAERVGSRGAGRQSSCRVGPVLLSGQRPCNLAGRLSRHAPQSNHRMRNSLYHLLRALHRHPLAYKVSLLWVEGHGCPQAGTLCSALQPAPERASTCIRESCKGLTPGPWVPGGRRPDLGARL